MNIKSCYNHILVVFIGILLITSCDRDDDAKLDIYDEPNFHHQENDALEDGTALFGGANAFKGDIECAISGIDSTLDNTYKVTYLDTTCDGKYFLTGTVIYKLVNGKWSDKNAVIHIDIKDFKKVVLKNDPDGLKTTTLNGLKTIKNITGGTEEDMADGDSIIREISGTNLQLQSINSNDGGTQTFKWNESRIHILIKIGNKLRFIYKGNMDDFLGHKLISWGTYKDDSNFKTYLDSTLVNEDCGVNGYKIIDGKKIVEVEGRVSKYTYGIDPAGLPLKSCESFGYLLERIKTNGKDTTYILSYAQEPPKY